MKRVLAGVAAFVAGMGGQGCRGAPAEGVAPAAAQAALVAPKPIPGGDYFPAQYFHRDGIIHQFYPVPGFDGPWAEPNGITDFNGFVAQIFQGGTAVDSAGNQYIVDVDNRVYVGEYIGVDGRHAFGMFCEL